jgi:ankyrin repeat protein
MKRREFLRTGLLLGGIGAVPGGVALATIRLSVNPSTIKGLVLPPLDDSAVFDLLVHAIEQDQLGIIKSLIGQGVDVHMKGGNHNETLLHVAADQSSMKAAQYLVSVGADVHALDKSGGTSLHLAARRSSVAMVRYLIEQGAVINAMTNSGSTPLHQTVRWLQRIDVLEYLTAHGADAHVRDKKGMTALDYVVEKESEIIERMKSQTDASEGKIRWQRGRIAHTSKAIDLLRKTMG